MRAIDAQKHPIAARIFFVAAAIPAGAFIVGVSFEYLFGTTTSAPYWVGAVTGGIWAFFGYM